MVNIKNKDNWLNNKQKKEYKHDRPPLEESKIKEKSLSVRFIDPNLPTFEEIYEKYTKKKVILLIHNLNFSFYQ